MIGLWPMVDLESKLLVLAVWWDLEGPLPCRERLGLLGLDIWKILRFIFSELGSKRIEKDIRY